MLSLLNDFKHHITVLSTEARLDLKASKKFPVNVGSWWWFVVSVLAFYSDDQSLNPLATYIFSKRQNCSKKRPVLAHLKKVNVTGLSSHSLNMFRRKSRQKNRLTANTRIQRSFSPIVLALLDNKD